MPTLKTYTMTCDECGFTTHDEGLIRNHSCDVQQQGGRCEDYPACGHEAGDCNGLLYGSDEAIKERVYHDIATGHGDCDHAEGIYFCDTYDDYDE
jgi:hypothetical protein